MKLYHHVINPCLFAYLQVVFFSAEQFSNKKVLKNKLIKIHKVKVK